MTGNPPKIISLLTDFGTRDGYVGVMKGVLSTLAPEVRFIDISHEISPQDVASARFLLKHSFSWFPPGTVHLAVVDPGVGSGRRGLAIEVRGHFFVGPDNGLFTPILEGAKVHSLEVSDYWLPRQSATFHGRDIFSPVAAHLARGVPLERFGPPVDHPVRLEEPEPSRAQEDWMGEVVYVDRFGNAVTNFTETWIEENRLSEDRGTLFTPDGADWPIVRTYSSVATGVRCAVMGGFACWELSINQGNASEKHGFGTGTRVCFKG
jgi:S-adenosylmethionine hydrolase